MDVGMCSIWFKILMVKNVVWILKMFDYILEQLNVEVIDFMFFGIYYIYLQFCVGVELVKI